MQELDFLNSFFGRLKSNKNEIQLHILAWSIFYIIDFSFVIGFTPEVNSGVIITYVSTIFVYIFCFYFIVEVYKKYFPSTIFRGLLISVLSVAFFSGLNLYWDVFIVNFGRAIDKFDTSPWNLYLFETWRFSTAALYAFAYWIYLQRIKDQKQMAISEKKLHNAEIAFLKAQINPHFLFNTLNFVYGDVVEKSEISGKAILSLTKLLRYSVESTKSENSSLRKEVEAIGEYLTLQNLRFGHKTNVVFNKTGMIPLFVIPPLVLLSLVENAFKYGIIEDPDNPVRIDLQVDREGLVFKCYNKKRLDFKDKETTSVGIANIKRRLDLTYEDDYELLVSEAEADYEVVLTIKWKK